MHHFGAIKELAVSALCKFQEFPCISASFFISSKYMGNMWHLSLCNIHDNFVRDMKLPEKGH